ncbi:MAG: hypothetical protein ACI9C4_002983 [Paraglaciecola sp.]|jgi:hypothetical protein
MTTRKFCRLLFNPNVQQINTHALAVILSLLQNFMPAAHQKSLILHTQISHCAVDGFNSKKE